MMECGFFSLRPCQNGLFWLFPLERAAYGLLPTRVETLTLVGTHRRFESAIDCPLLRDFLFATPETSCQACVVCRAERGGFRNLRTLHFHTQDISLELHERVIDYCSTVYA